MTPRMFVCTRTEVVVVELDAEMGRAMDVLAAAGILNDKTTDVLLTARRAGKPLVEFAHHYVSLASAVVR